LAYPITTIEVILSVIVFVDVILTRRFPINVKYLNARYTADLCRTVAQDQPNIRPELRSKFARLMAKKKKTQKDSEPKDSVVPVKDLARDIDDIFATKSIPKSTLQKPLKGILKAPTSTKPKETEVDDLASLDNKVRAAKAAQGNASAKALKDDDFADIRGFKKRVHSRDVAN
jgi:hypothetical protein